MRDQGTAFRGQSYAHSFGLHCGMSVPVHVGPPATTELAMSGRSVAQDRSGPSTQFRIGIPTHGYGTRQKEDLGDTQC